MFNTRPNTANLCTALAACTLACALSGCGSSGETAGGAVVSPAAFASTTEASANPETSATTARRREIAAEERARIAEEAATAREAEREPDQPTRRGPSMVAYHEASAPGGITTTPGAPAGSSAAPAPTEEPVLIDAKIGDINGKPIYASTFFEPIGARLQAEADRLRPPAWERFARQIIRRELDGQIADELLRAEAFSRLSDEQRQGLRAFLVRVREDIVSQSRGSEELTRRRLLEQEGLTPEEKIRQIEELQLVRLALEDEINKRVSVSRRDIEQRYERDREKYNPPPTAVFRLISVPKSQADEVTRITTALNDGASFEELAAEQPNVFRRPDAGLYETPYEEPFEKAEFFRAAPLNEIARELSPGRWTGPHELGSSVYFMRLEEIRQVSISLYEAQIDIERELTRERRQDELERYITRLVERARVADVDQLVERLYDVAARRYGPSRG